MEDLRLFRLHNQDHRTQNQPTPLLSLICEDFLGFKKETLKIVGIDKTICMSVLQVYHPYRMREKIIVYPIGFEPGTTEQQSKQKLKFAQVQKQVAIIHQKLKKRTDKPLIFIYHSFGTTLVSALLRLYYRQYIDRIIGMIAIGCYPVRFTFQPYLDLAESYTYEGLLDDVDILYKFHLQRSIQMNFAKSPNKFAYIAELIAFGKGMGFSEMFDYNRRWPPVLKCFIYGRQDNRIDEPLLNQTAIYYAFKRMFSKEYEDKIKDIFEKKYKLKVDNIQSRFIYNIQGGKHSIHIQSKYRTIIKNIISQYLSFIQQIHSV